MILVDVNLLIYAVNEDAPLHAAARNWLETAISGPETVGFAWNVVLAFIRLVTRSEVFRNPLNVTTAFEIVDAWRECPSVAIVDPTERHLRTMRDLLIRLGAAGNLTSDAHLAAIAIEHGAELCSTDGDFARFPGLRWRNPLDS
jgi:toxin-antitoxin system PIN domain toxin